MKKTCILLFALISGLLLASAQKDSTCLRHKNAKREIVKDSIHHAHKAPKNEKDSAFHRGKSNTKKGHKKINDNGSRLL